MKDKNEITTLIRSVIPNTSLTEAKIMIAIQSHHQMISIKELREMLDKDRTTIQKCITILLKKGICKQFQINLNRGFKYVYELNMDLFENIEQQLLIDYKTKLKILRQYKNK